MQTVALSELIPDHQHADSGPCAVEYNDWHALRMAEYVCPDALTKFYAHTRGSTDTRSIAWAHVEQALATKDDEEAHQKLIAARMAMSDGFQARRRMKDGAVGILLLSHSIPLMQERAARKTEGASFDVDTIEQHATAMALLGYAALDKLITQQNSLEVKTQRTLHRRGATAVLCSLINRQKDPELVAMPASPREESVSSRRAAIVSHDIAVISPAGKRAVTRTAKQDISPVATVIGSAFCNEVGAFERSRYMQPPKISKSRGHFHYVATMLHREATGSDDFDQKQADQLQSLSTWLVGAVEASTVFEQGNG